MMKLLRVLLQIKRLLESFLNKLQTQKSWLIPSTFYYIFPFFNFLCRFEAHNVTYLGSWSSATPYLLFIAILFSIPTIYVLGTVSVV